MEFLTGFTTREVELAPLQTLYKLMKYGLPMIGETGMNMSAQAEQVKTGISALFLLLLIPVAIALFFILRFIYRNTIGEKMKTTLLEDYKKEAEGFEKSGKYVSAANIYESKLRDRKKAAALYEKGGDYRKAASSMTCSEKAQRQRRCTKKTAISKTLPRSR